MTLVVLTIVMIIAFWLAIAYRPAVSPLTLGLIKNGLPLVGYFIFAVGLLLLTMPSLKAETSQERYDLNTALLITMKRAIYTEPVVMKTITYRAVIPFASHNKAQTVMEIVFGDDIDKKTFPFDPRNHHEYRNYRFMYFGTDREFLLVRRADEKVGYGTVYVLKKQ